MGQILCEKEERYEGYIRDRDNGRRVKKDAQKKRRTSGNCNNGDKKREEKEKLKRIKRKREMWEYINKKRGKKQRKGNNIEKEVWREHFMKLLQGTETYELEEDEGKEEEDIREAGQEEQEEEIKEEEIKKVVKKMKVKKATDIDGISMEVWKYAGETV